MRPDIELVKGFLERENKRRNEAPEFVLEGDPAIFPLLPRPKKSSDYPNGSRAKAYAMQAEAHRSEMWMWIVFSCGCFLAIVLLLSSMVV